MLQHRALVDRAFVGDFAAVDLTTAYRAARRGQSASRTGRLGRETRQALIETRAQDRISRSGCRSSRRQRRIDARQPSRSRMTMAASSSRLMPAITTSRTSGAQAATKRARSGPTLTQVPLPSLKSSEMRPSKSKPRIEVVGDGQFQRVAELIETFVVESFRGQFRLAPIARRHIRPLAAHLQACRCWVRVWRRCPARAGRHGRSGWYAARPT